MAVLVDLPVFILHVFLQNWCTYIDLVKLDSALCTNKLRTKFLGIIGSDQFVLDFAFPRHRTLLLDWVFRRKVSVNQLWIGKSTELPCKNSLAKVAKTARSLSLWELPLCKKSMVRTILQVSPSLSSLSIYECAFDGEVYSSISKYSPDIRNLDLTKVCIPAAFAKAMFQGFTKLTSLELSYGAFTSAAMLHIAYHCPHLKRFFYDEGWGRDPPFVYPTETLTSEVLTVICSMCTQLQSLTLSYYWSARHTMRLNVVYDVIVQRLPLLRTFDIHNVTITDNRGLETLFTSLHDLRHISINADGLSNEGLIRLLYQHPQLRNVSLNLTYAASYSCITGVNTAHIPLQLNRLYYLQLSRFMQLTDDGMHTILQACHVINNLSISEANLITPEFVIPLIVQLCPRMKHVYFDKCKQFTQGKVTGILTRLHSQIHVGVDAPCQVFKYDKYDEHSDSD